MAAPPPPPSHEDNVRAVQEHVRLRGPDVVKEPAGILPHRYMIPSGYYQQMWCWDTAFMGAGSFRSLPSAAVFLADAMKNYFVLTPPSGDIPGCVTPTGFSPTLRHAKPVLIWAAYCAARESGDYAQFQPYLPQMEALLSYWDAGRRFDAATGLHVWYDIMECGADDAPWYEPASIHTPGWTEEKDAYRVAAPDLQTFLVREHRALALFRRRWAEAEAAGAGAAGGSSAGAPLPPDVAAAIARHDAKVASLTAALNTHLWHWADEAAGDGWYVAYDVRTRAQLRARTYQAAWPLWEHLAPSRTHADAAVRAIMAPDMRCASGVRSTSSAHPQYSNTNMITPYSNWKGPVCACGRARARAAKGRSVRASGRGARAARGRGARAGGRGRRPRRARRLAYNQPPTPLATHHPLGARAGINVNCVLAYALVTNGYVAEAEALARDIVRTLADDLRANGHWHECYHSDDPSVYLAAPGCVRARVRGVRARARERAGRGARRACAWLPWQVCRARDGARARNRGERGCALATSGGTHLRWCNTGAYTPPSPRPRPLNPLGTHYSRWRRTPDPSRSQGGPAHSARYMPRPSTLPALQLPVVEHDGRRPVGQHFRAPGPHGAGVSDAVRARVSSDCRSGLATALRRVITLFQCGGDGDSMRPTLARPRAPRAAGRRARTGAFSADSGSDFFANRDITGAGRAAAQHALRTLMHSHPRCAQACTHVYTYTCPHAQHTQKPFANSRRRRLRSQRACTLPQTHARGAPRGRCQRASQFRGAPRAPDASSGSMV